jgi:putative hydrolase of the HAD superfamily
MRGRKMKIKAILFDLDNTLIDFDRFKRRSCDAAISAMIRGGLKIDKKKALKILFDLYKKSGIEDPKIFQKFLNKVEGRVNYKYLTYGILAYRKMKENNMSPYPGAIETIKKLKREYKIAIISDAPGINAWLRLISMKMDNTFDIVITKSDIKAQKPSSRVFRHVLKILKVRPSEAVMVGDRTERDIEGAKALGIKAVFARYGGRNARAMARKSGADFEIDDIRELIGILRKF